MAGRVLDSGSGWQELAAGSTPVLVALAIGLALWLVGDRLFRPASSLVGAGVGALFGLWASTVIPTETLGNVPTAYVTIGVGSLAGLAVGAAMYRLAIGTVGGLVFGCAAAALTIAISLQGPTGAPDVPDRPETVAEAAALRAASAGTPTTGGTVIPAGFGEDLSALEFREAASAAASGVGTCAQNGRRCPTRSNRSRLGAAILGCVVGFAAGLLKPRTIGPAVAALAGAALWLGHNGAADAGGQYPAGHARRSAARLARSVARRGDRRLHRATTRRSTKGAARQRRLSQSQLPPSRKHAHAVPRACHT
ncbi:MAG: hypothetical protein HND58_03945 [Planctomycetota bacterium]|nr:MAG: hypothetical protein HND58_03945 [Planctomycetota bacterium]